MSEDKNAPIAVEVAEAEFDRWCAAMRLRFHVDKMDAEDRKSFDAQRQVLLDAICDGNLVVNNDGRFAFTPVGEPGGTITFYKPKGAHFMEADNHKRSQEIKRGYAVMAAMTHENIRRFADMESDDLKVCMAIMALFLG